MQHNILVIDDDPIARSSMKIFLENEGFFVKAVGSGDEGIAFIRQKIIPFSVAFVDFHLGSQKAPEVLSKIRETDSKIRLVGLSGDDSSENHNRSLDSGALMFVSKETENDRILSIVHRLCRDVERKTKMLDISDPVENRKEIEKVGMVGISDHLRGIATLITRCAPSKGPVLIRGENGTGKEKVARAIHNHSLNPKGPFIAVNCGAITKDLIESELFGHEKGAFTGAVSQKIGKFQAANGGTIFLDEIGEMPLALQVTLLRVLQEKEITPVGSNTTKKIDVRVVAATNAPLESMIEDGQFRQDLYYRLNALPIFLKPLRERPEDIPFLADYFLKSLNQSIGKEKSILESCILRLQKYSWPGNVRELGDILLRMHLLGDEDVMTEELFESVVEQGQSIESDFLDYEIWRKRAIESEKILILRALNLSGHQQQTADLLGITRSHLRSRMRALNIKNPFKERDD